MGALVVVATPIGNVADLSTRAIETLRGADVICAEDTRHTRPLLDRIGATRARLVAVHAHNERDKAPDIAAWLEAGERVCFVSDAGCPGISDPGGRLVEAIVALGHTVEVIPGPSALTAALMGAGLVSHHVAFLGFLPRKGKERERLVRHAIEGGCAVVVYEAANRTHELIDDLAQWCGPRRVVVARELTKLHETFHRGTLGGPLHPPLVEKGEVVVVVEGGEAEHQGAAALDVVALVADTSLAPKEKARRLAHAQGISVREAYARLQQAQHASPLTEARRALSLAGEAAHALLAADDVARAARGEPSDETASAGADVVGADPLLRLLARKSALAAPVEAAHASKALLAALSAIDELVSALTPDDDESDVA